MLSFDATQLAIVASALKSPTWLFEVTNTVPTTYYWSTKSYTFGGQAYSFKVIPDSFEGVTMSRAKSELGIQAPSNMAFHVSNRDNALSAAYFTGGTVTLKLVVKAGANEAVIRSWKFRILDAVSRYQRIEITCEDYLQAFLEGDYPNTRQAKDIFYGSDVDIQDNVCIPVPFGTAYVPLRSAYIGAVVSVSGITISAAASAAGAYCTFNDSANGFGNIEVGRYITTAGFTEPANNRISLVLAKTAGSISIAHDAGLVTEAAGDAVTVTMGTRYYVLGSVVPSYTITKVRSPRDQGVKSEWLSGGYAFTQSTKTDIDAASWRVFQPIIADVDEDGTADAPGFWRSGDKFLDMPTQFTRSDTASTTSPADVIQFVLEDVGVPVGDIDVAGSFAAAKATYAGWGLTFNGAFWYKQPRENVLALLLNMCHSTLVFTDKIGLRVLSKTSKATIDKSVVLKPNKGVGSFSYKSVLSKSLSDCGHVAWQPSGEAQDAFLNILVPVKAARTVISQSILEVPFVQDSQDVQRIGTLYYQRTLTRMADVGFMAKSTLLALEPDDVVTINHADYGGTYGVLIDAIKINRNLSLEINAARYSIAFDDWGDLAPTAITVYSEDTTKLWQPPLGGPLSDKDIGKGSFDIWGSKYSAVVGPNTNEAEFTDIQNAINSLDSGGKLYIKRGTYQLTAPGYLPDRGIEVEGETQDGVILKNNPGSGLFVLHNLTKTYSFKNFTIQSQNSAVVSNIFRVYGDTAAQNTAKITMDSISADIVGKGIGMSSDVFLSLGLGDTDGKLDVANCIFTGDPGASVIWPSSTLGVVDVNGFTVLIQNNKVTGFSWGFILYCQNVNCDGNKFISMYGTAIIVNIYSLVSTEVNYITNNLVHFVAAPDNGSVGISGTTYASTAALKMLGNSVIGNFGANAISASGISVAGNRLDLNDNMVDLQEAAAGQLKGLSASFVEGSSIIANIVKVYNMNHTYDQYGLYLASAIANNLSTNNVNMGNSPTNVKDIGVYLDSNSNNNGGTGNTFMNCGTFISDNGSGNTVNKTGGGTF